MVVLSKVGPFPVPRKETKRLGVPTWAPGEHICLAHLSKELTRTGLRAWFDSHRGSINHPCAASHHSMSACALHSSLGHPRTGSSTDLRNSYTELSLSYPREHLPFYQTQLFRNCSQTQKVWQGQREEAKGISMTDPALWMGFLQVSRRTHSMCLGKVMVFFYRNYY